MRRECLLRSRASLALFGTVLAGGFLLAGPGNDLFLDSIELEGASGQTRGSNVGATAELQEPNHAGFVPVNTVWWKWTAESRGRLTVFTHGSSFDTLLALYTGETLVELTEVASNDDAHDALFQSLVEIPVEAGTTFHIAVDGFEDTGSVVLTWHLRSDSVTQPVNDAFVDRAELAGAAGQLITTNAGATTEPQEPSHTRKTVRQSVWFTWRAPGSGVAVVHCGGSSFDTLLAVYTGEGMETLSPVVSSDGEGVSSFVFFAATEGVEYHIGVDGFRGVSGIIVLNWELLSECRRPQRPWGPFPPQGAMGVGHEVTLEWDRTPVPRQRVIYGEDDRLDFYEVEDPVLRRFAESTVALVPVDELTYNDDGTLSLSGAIVGENRRLCPDERFRDQPNPAWCSGSLVGPDLVVTAGHCLTTTSDCAGFAFIFGFRMEGPDQPVLTFPMSQVYYCDEILGRELEIDSDWAVARLDRPVLDREPLEIRREGVIENGEGLLVIGHPRGWPVKVAGGAAVRENAHEAHFTSNLDVYFGNSGSPVFNAATLVVEGLLVRGEEDFEPGENCLRSIRCPDDACLGELVTRSTEFAELVVAGSSTIYEIHLGRCDVSPIELERVGETREKVWTVSGIEKDAIYCWQIVARNACGLMEGPLWTFHTAESRPEFIRGDQDGDGNRNLADAVAVLGFLFSSGAAPACVSAADLNDDGQVNLLDPVALLDFLFSGDVDIPPPVAACGVDPTPDELTCESFVHCGVGTEMPGAEE